MMSRQTFYIAKDLSDGLRKLAFVHKTKLSVLVSEAIKYYLKSFKLPRKRHQHSLLIFSGKIKSLRGVDPIDFQQHVRSSWD